MKDNHKAYGFVIAMPEYPKTIPSLWDATQRFAAKYPKYIDKNNAIEFIVDGNKGIEGEYNMCHFWSNFEIGDLNFWRSEAYLKYFEWLDEEGGFYYERWVRIQHQQNLFISMRLTIQLNRVTLPSIRLQPRFFFPETESTILRTLATSTLPG